MFHEHSRWWKQHAGPEAHKAIKARDWESILVLALRHRIRSVLEFGSGLSTILLSRVFPQVTSLETNASFMSFVAQRAPEATFLQWDNQHLPDLPQFDLALVDGILPRKPQALGALHHARLIAVHDPGASGRDAIQQLYHLEVIPQVSPYMRVFLNKDLA